MGIKDTKLWLFLRNIKNKIIAKRNYNNAKKMPLNEYENYLVNRTYEMMKRKSYSAPFAYSINFDNPTTFTEKRQWLKLHDQDPRKSIYTDKYEVRKHIIEVLGEEYLIPLISINGKDCFGSVNEINFDKLPNSFVIKCTHGSHMNIIVKDKSKLTRCDIRKYKKQLNKWLKTNYAYVVAAELHYKDIKPRIIIEEYVEFSSSALTDYKFFCFSGKPVFLGVFENRWSSSYMETYLDMNYKILDFKLDNYPTNKEIQKPNNFEKMLEIAKTLCEDFKMVRVDLYSLKGIIYFGELTFTSASGYDFPNPFSLDKEMGKLIKINKSVRDNNFTYRKQ